MFSDIEIPPQKNISFSETFTAQYLWGFFFFNITLMKMSSPTIQKTFKSCSFWFKAGLEIWCLTLWVITRNYTLQAILEKIFLDKISDWGEMMEREVIVFFFHSVERTWILQCNRERNLYFSESRQYLY